MHLKRMLRMSGVVVVASLSYATAARAESVIVGTVVNTETKKPMADVVVTATSPNLEGEQIVVTDAQGQYRIPALPPGVYTLRFDVEGFKPFSRSELPLRLDRILEVNVELINDQYEDIDWGYGPSLIDVSGTTTGQSIYPDFTRRLAMNRPAGKGGAARSFESLAEVVPGTQSETYGVSINGASPSENRYVVDGLSTLEPVFGFNASPLSVEFLQDFEVITGGAMPEHGRATGGVLRAVTRSGSNEFHGSVFGNWVPGILASRPPSVPAPGAVISGQNALRNLGDFGATLGGPVMRDRLWFFAGVAPSLSLLEHRQTVDPRVGTSRSYFAEERRLQAMGKLTYLINQDHNVSLSFITTPTHTGGAGQLTVDPRTGGIPEVISGMPSSVGQLENDSNYMTTGLKYSGALLDKELLLDVNLGWSRQTASDRLADGANGVGLAVITLHNDKADRYQANAQVTWLVELAGYHVLKAGVDTEHVDSERTWTQPGGVVLGGGASQLGHTSRYTSNLLGAFVQDSWLFFRGVTANVGLRYDSQWLYQDDGRLALALPHQFSPRVGLVVDPLNSGRMKLFAHYAKYRGLMPLGLMEQVFPSEALANQKRVDSDIVPPSSTELVTGAEYELLAYTRLSANYTHRDLDSAIEDMSRDDGNSYFLGNPGAGLASDFPKAKRTHDAVTVALDHTFRDGWLAQASYTWSRLYGNYVGPYPTGFRSGQTVRLSDFALPFQMENREGLLPYDRTHTLKLLGARDIQITRALRASLGLSYLGRSGTPINYLGGHPLLGEGETFVLPRGSSGERTPWVHSFDTNVRVSYRFDNKHEVSLTLDVFNLFNFQQATRVDENYTYASVLPLEGVKVEELKPGRVTKVNDDTGLSEPLTEADLNPYFKKPLQYQTPRQVRLGLRYTF